MIVTLKNRPFRYYLAFTISATAFETVILATLPVFGKEIIYQGVESTIASLIPGAFVITAVLVAEPSILLINKLGKKKTTSLSLIVMSIFVPLLLLVSFFSGVDAKIAITLVIVLLSGIPAAPMLILPDSLISDTTDYDEKVTGKRLEAMHFATQEIITRTSGGIPVQLMGIVQGFSGATYPNTLGISLTIVLSVTFLLLGLLFFIKYPEKEVLAACTID